MKKLVITILIILYKSMGGFTQKLDSLVKMNPKLPTVLEFRNNNALSNPNFNTLKKDVKVTFRCGCSGNKSGLPPLYILDGVEVADLEVLTDANNIESLKVLNNQKDVEKYGDKGRNGIIIVTTKKSLL